MALSRRHTGTTRTIAIVLGALTAFVLAAGAQAATPKPGCWGTCGGPAGPVGGVFFVMEGKVTDFGYTESCLGSTTDGSDYFHLTKAIAVAAGGSFSYAGPAAVSDLSSGKSLYSVHVTLAGSFTSTVKATVKITVAHRGCMTKQLSIRQA